jgi:hypothetical protein
MIEQSRKAEIELAIAIGYAGRIENPADLREDDRKVNADAAWDALGF